jgi:hypothetical protein
MGYFFEGSSVWKFRIFGQVVPNDICKQSDTLVDVALFEARISQHKACAFFLSEFASLSEEG